jgi:hypothetical protein
MNLPVVETTMAKMMLKMIRSKIDYLEILVALGEPKQAIMPLVGHWVDDLRHHLERLETMTEQTTIH